MKEKTGEQYLFGWQHSTLLILSFVTSVIAGIVSIVWGEYLCGSIVSVLLVAMALVSSVYCWRKEKRNPFDISVLLIVIAISALIAIAVLTGLLHEPLGEGLEYAYLDKWDWIALIVAISSLAFAGSTWHSQYQTERNTMRITPESQKDLLIDYVRHFYANLIIICALEARMDKRYDLYYPSEEHLLKLRVDVDSLHPAAFFNHSEKYKSIHRLKFLMRNFNMELEVIARHLSDKNVHEAAKERDFATLRFKMALLSNSVAKTVKELFGETDEEIAEQIRKHVDKAALERNQKGGEDVPLMKKADKEFDSGMAYYYAYDSKSEKQDLLIKTLFPNGEEKDIEKFLRRLNQNIYTEVYGYNDSNGRKIFLIPFDKNTPIP